MMRIHQWVSSVMLGGMIVGLSGCLSGCLSEAEQQSPPAATPTVASETTASPVAIQPNAPQAATKPSSKPSPKPTDSAEKSPTKMAGDYCYSSSTPNLTAEAKLNIQGNDVTGNIQGLIHNKSAGYFTGYSQAAIGSLSGDQAKVQLKIEVDGDKQTAEETWTITEKTLKTKRETFGRVDCGELGQLNEKAKAAITAPANKPKPAIAIKPPTREGESRIDFANGGNTLKTTAAIVRDEQKVYIFTAKKGQTFTVSVTSPENNAVLELVGPDRKTIKREVANFEYALPTDGDYRVIVGSRRGNAEFTLNAGVK